MTAFGRLTYDITDPLTHKAAAYFALEIYEPLFTMALKPDFLDENAIMLDEQKTLTRDTKVQDYHFQSFELIPGFPFQEFDGTSAFQTTRKSLIYCITM